jgi:hypothetical protein
LHLLAAGRSAHILPLVARLLKRATTLCPPRLLCPQWCLAHPGSLCGKMCWLVLLAASA